eukprot:4796123-Prorocentrum_lima.AAC.1
MADRFPEQIGKMMRFKKSTSSSTWLLRPTHRHLNEGRAVPCLVLPSAQLTSGLFGEPESSAGNKADHYSGLP